MQQTSDAALPWDKTDDRPPVLRSNYLPKPTARQVAAFKPLPANAVTLKQTELSPIPKNVPAMSLSLDSYRTKLINKILLAASQEDVKRFIAMAVKSLEAYKLNGHIIARFLEKTLAQLALLNPMKKSAQQWSNILMARILLNRIIKQAKSPAI